MEDINNIIIKEYSTKNLDSLKLDIKYKYHLKLSIYYADKNSVKDKDFLTTEELSICNINDYRSIEFENCKFNDLKSLYFFETEAKENNDAHRHFSITFKNCELNEEILIENKTKKLVSVIFENNKEETPVVTIGKNKIDNDGKKENLIQFEFMNFSIINSTIDAKMIKIVNNSKSFNFKKCIFNSDVDITIQNCSINKFENCNFNGGNTKVSIQNIQRTEPGSFKKCEFNNSNLTINGIQTNPLHLEIEDGKFNVNKIDIKQININFKNVEFEWAKFDIDKNEDIKHRYGSAKIPSNLSFFGGAWKKFELRDYGNNSFKFENCNNINYLSFKNGAQALELFNCIIKKFTINGEITEKAIFNNVTFENPPEIGDIKFKNCNVDFSDVKFGDINSSNAIAGFRALNKACRDANYHHGEIFFHGLMLERRGEELKLFSKDFVEKILFSGYKLFGDYGRNLNRALVLWVTLVFIFFGINYYEINKINNLKLSENSVINKSIVENINNFEEEQNQLNKINKKIVFRNAIDPFRIGLPQDFIKDYEEKLFKEKINSDYIYFLNIIHPFLSLGIFSIWLFMIAVRFKYNR